MLWGGIVLSERVTGLPELKWRRKLSPPPSASATWLSGARVNRAHPIGRTSHPLLASDSDPGLLSGWAGLAANQEQGRRGTGLLESHARTSGCTCGIHRGAVTAAQGLGRRKRISLFLSRTNAESIPSIVLSADPSLKTKGIRVYRYFLPNLMARCRPVCGHRALNRGVCLF